MPCFLIAVKQMDYQNYLKKWFEDRHQCFIPDFDEPLKLDSIILNMDYDFAFVDESILNVQRDNIRRRKLKEYPVILPFIYLTSHRDDKSISELWTIVDDIITPPLKRFEIYMRTHKLLKYRKMTLTLHYIAVTDYLTGFFSHKCLIIIGDQEFQQAKRYKRPLSVIYMDIDGFKKINDNYSYILGDKVIRSIAQRCYLSIRVADIPGRYDGEEFIFILPETSVKSAAITAERLRRIIYEKPFIVDGHSISITASFGVTELTKNDVNIQSLFDKAYQAMLRAKKKGCNKVEINY